MKILIADAVHTVDRSYQDAWVAIEEDRIAAVGEGAAPTGDIEKISGEIIPGFVDVHVHGGGGANFSDEPTQVIKTHRKFGTTRIVASLVSSPAETLIKQINLLKPLVKSGELLGIHLEGPFLAAECRGAHQLAALRNPDPEIVRRLLDAADGTISSVTMAPELDHAMEAIEIFKKAGVLVCLGHTAASADLTRQAISAGASAITHLFNGMPPIHHRGSGIVDEALINDALTVEMILDGHHISDNIVRLALASASNRWIAVTDAMAAAGHVDGNYLLGELSVQVKNGMATLADGTSLAGSTLTMETIFSRLLSTYSQTWQSAIAATSYRPGKLFNRNCSLHEGSKADLVVWNHGRASAVMRDGQWVQ